MNRAHLVALFIVALAVALAGALGAWYVYNEEPQGEQGGARIAVEESVDLLVGQSTVLSPVLVDESGAIHSDAVFEFSCADEDAGSYLKIDNVQQGKITAVGYTEQPLAVRIVNQAYGVQAEVQVRIENVLTQVLGVQCASGSVRYGEDVVLYANVLPRGCSLEGSLSFTVTTSSGESIPAEQAFSEVSAAPVEGRTYSHIISLRGCALGSGTLGLSVSYGGEEGAYSASFPFELSLEDGTVGSALASAADTDEDGFASRGELSAVRSLTISAAADFSVLDDFPSVEEVSLPADTVTAASGLPSSGNVRFYVPDELLFSYLADDAWKGAGEHIFPLAAAQEGARIAVLHSEYDAPLAVVDLSDEPLPVYSQTGYTHTGWSEREGGAPAQAEEIAGSVHLYALWRSNAYSVRFEGNGNDGGGMEAQNFTYDREEALAPNGFTKTGYTFAGWAGAADGDAIYEDGAEVLNLTVEDGGIVTLYAVWSANTYTVTFDYGEGSGDVATMQVTFDAPYGPLPAAVLPGNIGFWTLSGQAVDASTIVKTAGDHTLVAGYRGEDLELTLYIENSFVAVRKVTHGMPYGELFPQGEDRLGYTLRWFTEQVDGEEVTAKTIVTAIDDHALYGRYVANTYTVTFDYRDYAGEGDVLTMQVTYEALYGPLPEGSRTGYVVTWRSNVGGVVDAATRVATPADHTLTAEWSPIGYTVFFADGYTDGGNGEEQSFVYDVEQALKEVQFSREGYTFLGWSSEKGADEALYAAGEVVKNLTAEQGGIVRLYAVWKPYTFRVTVYPCTPGTSGAGEGHSATLVRDQLLADTFFVQDEYAVGYSVAGFSTQQNGPMEWALGDPFNYSGEDGAEVTLYAVWRANVYEVHFDGNGNDGGGMGAQNFTYDREEALTANGFTKTGYTFAGWAFSRSGDIAYQDSAEVLNLTSEEGGIVTLYARWRANSYTVTFDPNGGTGSMPSQSFTYDSSQALHAQAFERVGYTFAGWSRTADGQVEFADGEVISNLSAEPNGTVTLYAVWRANTYTVTFDYGAGSGNVATMQVTFDAPYGTLPTANREGDSYKSKWTLNGEAVDASTIVKTAGDHTLVAEYTRMYLITVNAPHVKVTITNLDTGEGISSNSRVPAGTRIRISYTADDGYENAQCSHNGDYTVNSDITISGSAKEKKSCFAKGTMIMRGDGSMTPVENIKAGDSILAFDHLTGSYIESRVAYTYRNVGEADKIQLFFADGSEIVLINLGHGLFDATLNKYVLINAENVAEFVGHEFYCTEYSDGVFIGKNVRLTSYLVSKEVTERYDLVTEKTLNCIANNILVCSDALVGISNVFDFAEGLQYDLDEMQNDIETYGLFEYEEWAEYLSRDDFEKFNGAYFKVALGKGLVTMDEIHFLLQELSVFWEGQIV